MITDTQIVDAIVAVLPLNPFALFSFLAGAPIHLPIAELERAAETPFVAPFAAVLLAAVLVTVTFVIWVLFFAIWIAALFAAAWVNLMAPQLATIVNAVVLARGLVAR